MKLHWFLKINILFFTILLFWLFIAYIIPKLLPLKKVSNTSRQGFIIQKERWSGTIRITGDTWSLPGAVVTLEPGTKILITRNDKFNMDFLPWHIKDGINIGLNYHGIDKGEPFWDEKSKIQLHFGKLFAIGTKEQPVIITSDTSNPSVYDINVISVKEGVLSNAKLSNYRRFEIGSNVTIQNSELENTGECALCLNNGKPTILNNVFHRSIREYIWIAGASPRISNNQFLTSPGVGIKIDPKEFGAPVITHNDFEMPGSVSLYYLTGDEVSGSDISYNYFAGNSSIKIPCDSKVRISNNAILGSVGFLASGCSGKYLFGSNYWGSSNLQAVTRERILGVGPKLSIIITSILDTPPQNVGRIF